MINDYLGEESPRLKLCLDLLEFPTHRFMFQGTYCPYAEILNCVYWLKPEITDLGVIIDRRIAVNGDKRTRTTICKAIKEEELISFYNDKLSIGYVDENVASWMTGRISYETVFTSLIKNLSLDYFHFDMDLMPTGFSLEIYDLKSSELEDYKHLVSLTLYKEGEDYES